jgi:hypothetical protein
MEDKKDLRVASVLGGGVVIDIMTDFEKKEEEG